jgi:hypothetical protein
MSRVVAHFSCGAASAVATKLTIAKHGSAVVIVRCVIGSEHEDNDRFARDVEQWFGQKIIELRNPKYADTWSVYERERFLVSPKGARRTTELKKLPGRAFWRPGDIDVFGYHAGEVARLDAFRTHNPELTVEAPLIEAQLFKPDCLALIERAGIMLPAMYRLGFKNNNCVGCVKGGAGYWNMIRRFRPAVFWRMARLERKLNVAIVKLGGVRVFLDELPENAGRYDDEPDIECGLFCAAAAEEMGAGRA